MISIKGHQSLCRLRDSLPICWPAGKFSSTDREPVIGEIGMNAPKLLPMLIAAIAMSGCDGVPEGKKQLSSPDRLEGSWQVEDIDNQGVIDNAMVRVDFSADGRVSGRGGCNTFGGAYAYADGVATFGALAATEMACAPALMDMEAKFFNRLQGELAVSMTEDGALVLSDDEGRILMRRMDDAEAARSKSYDEERQANTPSPAPRGVSASGEVTWPAGATLPEGAFLRVKLIDVSRVDVASQTLDEVKFPITGRPPVVFALTNKAAVDPSASLSVSAQISDGAALHFVSDTNNPVSSVDGASEMRISLVLVNASPGTGVGGLPVTPSPDFYECGGERFALAFEAGAAYVTMPDGALEKLDRLEADADPEAPRTFTNGRLTFVQETEGAAGPLVRFARGKMALSPCAR